jgi:16S rRNA (guanine527-N7)-methyltransferase
MKIGSPQWAALITEGARTFGLSLEPDQVSRFAVHASELIKWNKKFNLTRITDPREVALKHYVDSLAPARWIPQFSSLLDVGSGGGFPGIPLKIVNPSITLTLIDGSRKRINFLKHCLRMFDFEKCEALQIRGEELAADIESSSSAGYDVIISRALGSLEVFAQIALPLLAEKGTIIALKGKADTEEFEALADMVSKIKPESKSQRPYLLTHHAYKLPLVESRRSIIIIKKGY